MARDRDLDHLHPVMREKVKSLLKSLEEANNPMKLFEGFRTPHRQRQLYCKGRSCPGSVVTNANAWQSMHQYGVAADFVLFIDGNWSWKTRGSLGGYSNLGQYWDQLHELGEDVGLKHLSWEKPHLQLEGVDWRSMLNYGRYPDGGDESWAENLENHIEAWGRGAPPVPDLIVDRPPLDGDDGGGEKTGDTGSTSRFRVNARSGLRMRELPGTQYDIVGTLSDGSIVHGLSTSGEWVKVDSQGDGKADGFCHGAYLEPV